MNVPILRLVLALAQVSFCLLLVEADPLKRCENQQVQGLLNRINPYNYNVHMVVDSNSLKYHGQTTIWHTVNDDKHEASIEPKNLIVLHADNNLDIGEVTYELRGPFGHPVKVNDVCRVSEKQLLVVTLDTELEDRSLGAIHIQMAAKIRGDGKSMRKLTGNNGRPIYRANFGHNNARSLIPCFDNQRHLAIFNIFIVHDRHLVAAASTADNFRERSLRTASSIKLLSIYNPGWPISIDKVEFEFHTV